MKWAQLYCTLTHYVTSHCTLYSSSGLHRHVAGAKGGPLEAAEVAFGVRLALKAMIVYCSTLVKSLIAERSGIIYNSSCSVCLDVCVVWKLLQPKCRTSHSGLCSLTSDQPAVKLWLYSPGFPLWRVRTCNDQLLKRDCRLLCLCFETWVGDIILTAIPSLYWVSYDLYPIRGIR